MPKSIGNIKKTKTTKVVHNRPTAPERVQKVRSQLSTFVSYVIVTKLDLNQGNVKVFSSLNASFLYFMYMHF